MELQTIEAIRALKYRYLRTLDLKLWDDFADTMCEDIVANYGSPSGGQPLRFEGRNELVEYMRGALSGPITTVHIAGHPEITVDGDRATGSWVLEDTVLVAEYSLLLRGACYYEDEYRLEGGTWRIAKTGYRRLYETMTNFAEDKQFTVTANMWA